MDAFVSVSNNEELNIMASVLAKRLGAKKTITIVNRNDYLSLGRGLGLQAVLSPRLITASSILKYVRKGEILSLTAVAEEKAEIIEARIGNGSKLMGKAIEMAKLPKSSLVGAIIRDEQIIIPSGSDVINEGDKVIIFTLRESIPALGKLLG
jgi:trk system potassium uptake protein TrkA